MFAQTTCRSLVYSLFSAMSIFSFSLYPIAGLTHPSLGSQCSSCHGGGMGNQTGSTTSTGNTTSTIVENTSNTTVDQPVGEEISETTDDTTTSTIVENTSSTTVDQPVEEEISETTDDSATEPLTEEDIAETTNTTEQPAKEDVTENNSTGSTTETGSSSSTTTGNNTTGQTSGQVSKYTSTDLMTEFDIDGDGQITQTEMQFAQTESFKTVDTNGNNYLSREELLKGIFSGKFYGYGCQLNFARLDSDSDQSISQDEFVNNVPLFDKFDIDSNGIVTKEELNVRRFYNLGCGKLHGMGHEKLQHGSMNPSKGGKGKKHH